jgi:hypothetical protein
VDAHRGERPAGADLIVVPWAPAPPIRLTRTNERDEIDELLDDLFGPDDDGGPGWFDAALLAVGVGSVTAVAAGALGTGWLWLGVPALLLGLVLPLRSAWRSMQRRRARRAMDQKLGRGLPIDAADPDVARLLAAYESLRAAAAEPAVSPVDESAVVAAHDALLEAASLLRGAPPVGPAERDYVRRRSEAITELAQTMQRHSAAVAAEQAQEAEAAKELDRAARLEALTELDGRLGPDSVEQMASLRQAIEGGTQP